MRYRYVALRPWLVVVPAHHLCDIAANERQQRRMLVDESIVRVDVQPTMQQRVSAAGRDRTVRRHTLGILYASDVCRLHRHRTRKWRDGRHVHIIAYDRIELHSDLRRRMGVGRGACYVLGNIGVHTSDVYADHMRDIGTGTIRHPRRRHQRLHFVSPHLRTGLYAELSGWLRHIRRIATVRLVHRHHQPWHFRPSAVRGMCDRSVQFGVDDRRDVVRAVCCRHYDQRRNRREGVCRIHMCACAAYQRQQRRVQCDTRIPRIVHAIM